VLLVTLKEGPIFTVTIPGKLQSYFACARPVIGALDGEGAKLIRRAKAGIVVAPGDPESLSQAIIELYQTPLGAREEMGANARKYYDNNFNRDTLIGNFISLMKRFSPPLIV
jgi:glycosyltransferase involved in cell wall biosynthesis